MRLKLKSDRSSLNKMGSLEESTFNGPVATMALTDQLLDHLTKHVGQSKRSTGVIER